MKDIERFDEQVKNDPAAEAARARRKRNQAIFRRSVVFVGKIILTHLAMMIIFNILFSSSVVQMITDSQNSLSGVNPNRYKTTVTVFSLFSIALLSFVASIDLSASGERRRDFGKLLENENISFSLMYRESKADIMLFAATYLIFQIPMCIFYHVLGFYYLQPTVFEQFHIMDMGFLEITGIGVVGIILNTVFFVAVLALFNILTYLKWSKKE